MNHKTEIRVLAAGDLGLMRGMLDMFGAAFEDVPTYTRHQPDDSYLAQLLAGQDFMAIAAVRDYVVIGGLAAYVLRKFEQPRAEVYIHDLAVDVAARRQGIATAMIRKVQQEASARGAYVVFVQADHGDEAAIALYSRLGVREDVLHFDIQAADPKQH